jgi:hypothetical protein
MQLEVRYVTEASILEYEYSGIQVYASYRF